MSDSDASTDNHDSFHDFDLDVVHDALNNPNGTDYLDHFGFRIQVKTDDEYDQDTSDDDDTHSDITQHQNNSIHQSHSTTNTSSSLDNGAGSSSSSSLSFNDDGAYTATTTPTTAKTRHLSIPFVDDSTLHVKPNAGARRGRSYTMEGPSTSSQSIQNNRPRAATLTTLPTTFNQHNYLTTMCDTDLNAADSCPTNPQSPSSSINSDGIPSSPSPMTTRPHPPIERPSDVYRNRQIQRISIPHHSTTSYRLASSDNFAHLKETSSDTHDWDFWAMAIKDFESVKQQQTLRDHLIIGIPPSLRGILWQACSRQCNYETNETIYQELLKQTSPHEKIIQRDLTRTFPTLTFFRQRDGQQMLFNVIKAYSLYDPQVGYCQGLPFIVGCLLLQMPDEAAFCVLIDLMHTYNLRGHFTPKMELLHERMYQFDDLLKTHLPPLHRHLEAQGVRPTMYASQWFMTLFAYRCPLELVFRILDMIFTQGTSIILNVALALLEKNQSILLSLEFEHLLQFLGSDIFNAYQDDSEGLVRNALAITIHPRTLAKLSKRYQVHSAEKAKRQDKEDHLRNENYELSRRAKELTRSYDTLNQEHQELSKQVIDSKLAMATAYETHQALLHTIAQIEHQMNQPFRDPQFDRLALENAQLVERNAQLEDQLAHVESTLIEFKMKYAQSENDYEQMKNTLRQIEKMSRAG